MSRVKVERDKSEARIQQDAVTYIRNNYPETYGCFYHIPNGGWRDKITASILAGQGVVPGVQDLHFIWNGRLWIIEVKTTSGQVSPAQKVIHAQHKRHGFDTYLLRTLEEIIAFVEAVMKGEDMSAFDGFISPYSDAEMYEVYLGEMREERCSGNKKIL